MTRCQLCGSPCGPAQEHCSKGCARAAREAAKDGIEARLRRAFARKRRPAGPAPDPESEVAHLEVEGFWAPGCAGAAEEILRSVPGVHDARVAPGTGRGRAWFDPERAGERDLLRALRRYGFRASRVRDPWARAEGFPRRWEIATAVRLGVCAMITLYVFAMSALLSLGLAGGERQSESVRVLLLFFSLPVLVYGGAPVFAGAAWSAARRRVSADLLAAAAAFGAFVVSLKNLLAGGDVFFDAACAAVTVTLFARFCEDRARRRLAKAAERLAAPAAVPAVRVRRSEEIPCAAAELRPGDVALAATGARVPADGEIVEGSGVVEPVSGGRREVSSGDPVAAGSRVAAGRLLVRVERAGPATALGEVARAVEESASTRMPGAAAAARGLVWIGVGVAAFGLVALGYESGRLEPMVAVLLAAAPTALAILPSIAGLSALARAAERRTCLRGGDALAAVAAAEGVVLLRSALVERRAHASPVALDADPAEFWSVVATLAAAAADPAGAALRERAASEGALPLAPVAPGDPRLSRASFGGRDAALGARAALEGLGWTRGVALDAAIAGEEGGRSLVWVGWNGAIRGAVSVDAPEREGAGAAGPALRRLGLLTCLGGSDADAALDAQATRLGLDTWMAEAALASGMERRSERGRGTLLVAAAAVEAPAGSETAQVRLALECGEEGPPEWADVLAVGPGLGAVGVAVGSGRRAVRAVRGGGVLAFVFHVVVLPCAAVGLVTPVVAVGLSAAAGMAMIFVGFRAGGE